MPRTGEVRLEPGTREHPETGYRSRFSHDDETAEPGYYSVLLKDTGIRAELTATERTGLHRSYLASLEGGHSTEALERIMNLLSELGVRLTAVQEE